MSQKQISLQIKKKQERIQQRIKEIEERKAERLKTLKAQNLTIRKLQVRLFNKIE